jgi:uncharacterized OB-fold protein
MHDAFPLPDLDWEATRPYWDGAARGELVLPRCDACGQFVWYPRRHCDGDALTWVPVSGTGTLFSWSVVRHPFLPQFRELVPFAPALVSLDDDPSVRIVTRIVDCDVDDLRADMPVEVVFRPLTFPGVAGDVTAPLFRPSET